jgi:hypothetical protein
MHQMNSLKVLMGGAINGVAVVYFVSNRMVFWPDVVLMGAGAIAGGYGGAGLARRVVIVIGFGLALSFFFRR